MTSYDPTAQYTEALAEFNRTKEAHDEAKKKLRAATAEELKISGLPGKTFAPLSPWSEETLRGIVHEYGIPLKRNPTVKSIKPRKRTAGDKTSG